MKGLNRRKTCSSGEVNAFKIMSFMSLQKSQTESETQSIQVAYFTIIKGYHSRRVFEITRIVIPGM